MMLLARLQGLRGWRADLAAALLGGLAAAALPLLRFGWAAVDEVRQAA